MTESGPKSSEPMPIPGRWRMIGRSILYGFANIGGGMSRIGEGMSRISLYPRVVLTDEKSPGTDLAAAEAQIASAFTELGKVVEQATREKDQEKGEE